MSSQTRGNWCHTLGDGRPSNEPEPETRDDDDEVQAGAEEDQGEHDGQPRPHRRPRQQTAATANTDTKKLSQIEVAVAVLAKAGEPMNCKAMVEAMAKQGLWSSPGGKTPEGTLENDLCLPFGSQG